MGSPYAPDPLRTDQAVAEIYTARSLADTLQAIADAAVSGFGYELAAVNLVRPDGDLVVAALAGSPSAEALLTGRVGSRAAWERRLAMGEDWEGVRFIPHTEGWVLNDDDVPQWHTEGPAPEAGDGWHPEDRLFAPMYSPLGELIGVISVDRPGDGRRPGAANREALRAYAFHAAIAISNARLRANMQRALVRLEREQQALRASEESFRQAFEYAPSGMAIAEMGGDQHGRLLRTNDALCRLLGRPASVMRRYSFSDLVHPEDIGTLLRTSAEGGRADLRLARRDGSYVWVAVSNSVVADTADGPRFLMTHVDDIEERKRHEQVLEDRASRDELTGLLTESELRLRLGRRLCDKQEGMATAARNDTEPETPTYDPHRHKGLPAGGRSTLALLHFGVDAFKAFNTRHGLAAGDVALTEIAHRLREELGTWDEDGDLARVRGDEFLVVAHDLDDSGADALAARLRECVRRPVEGGAFGGVSLDVTGVHSWATCGTSPDQLLRRSQDLLHARKTHQAI
ncbi:PAS domain S-box protein [Streptomyces sp. NPDC014870]|uniref:PAS domain S-box protein n=1 Tax=Streptomyces sp. NPDC014870 TaxID=3364925 RepID=UPI0036FC9A4A